ncbi:hypothetical protein [Marivita sp.]|uniref:hypothetical protein n=1 Tax=Marivita sp. TaxID=2003365 RepID=UPI003A863B9F
MLDDIGHAARLFRKGTNRNIGCARVFLEPKITRQTVQNLAQVIFLTVRKLDRLFHHHLAGKVIHDNPLRQQIAGLGTTMDDIDLRLVLLGKFGGVGKDGCDHAITTHWDQNGFQHRRRSLLPVRAVAMSRPYRAKAAF